MTVTSITKAAALLALIAMLVSGCGRKSDLDVPPARPGAEDPDKPDSEKEKEDRPFFLDALIK